ncbi:MAG: DinB family protein [Gemmatimonadota bacterium]
MLSIPEATGVLQRTPGTLRSLLEGLPDAWVHSNEGPETWSPAEVVAHLADLERQDWVPRLRIILEEGPERPFEPVDRVAFRKTLKGKQLPELLRIFAERRAASLETLQAMRLTDSDLDRPGTHPELGRVDLGALLATWAVHDLNHLGQIVRVMAKRYETAVGPWKQVLAILNWK